MTCEGERGRHLGATQSLSLGQWGPYRALLPGLMMPLFRRAAPSTQANLSASLLPKLLFFFIIGVELTQGIGLAILVRDGEDAHNFVTLLPQAAVHLLAEQALANDG